MLRANHSLGNSTLETFRSTLSEKDEERLDRELDAYAKDLVSIALFESDYEVLRNMLKEKEISPLLFQWILAVREGLNGQSLVLEA